MRQGSAPSTSRPPSVRGASRTSHAVGGANRGILYVDAVNCSRYLVDLLLDEAAMGRSRSNGRGLSRTPARLILVGTMNPRRGVTAAVLDASG